MDEYLVQVSEIQDDVMKVTPVTTFKVRAEMVDDARSAARKHTVGVLKRDVRSISVRAERGCRTLLVYVHPRKS